MSRIVYKYEIVHVDYESKSMEIVYRNPTYGTLHVGARLPYENETVDQIVSMYAPIATWLEQDKKALQVSVGLTGMSSEPIETTAELPSWLANRLTEYGSPATQIEFITENGIDAWKNKVNSIKEKYPKPTED